METNETKERKLYHQYLIRVDDETIIELQNLGFQFKTCFVWKKRGQTDELEVGEMSVDYSNGYPNLIFREREDGVEHIDIDLVENDKKTSILEFFIEDGWRD